MSSFWSTSIIDVYRRDVEVLFVGSTIFTYFALRVLALGEGDAAGEGLAEGLGLLAGALPVALGEGDVDGEGLAVIGEVELLTGSVVQPAASTIENVVRSASAVRRTMSMFGVLISFYLVPPRLKSGMMIAQPLSGSNGCFHRSLRGIPTQPAPNPSVSKRGLARLANAGQTSKALPSEFTLSFDQLVVRKVGLPPPLG